MPTFYFQATVVDENLNNQTIFPLNCRFFFPCLESDSSTLPNCPPSTRLNQTRPIRTPPLLSAIGHVFPGKHRRNSLIHPKINRRIRCEINRQYHIEIPTRSALERPSEYLSLAAFNHYSRSWPGTGVEQVGRLGCPSRCCWRNFCCTPAGTR